MDMIELFGGDKVYKFPLSNTLPMETVRSYCTNAVGLDYDVEGTRLSVIISNDIAKLIPGVNKYYVVRKPVVSRKYKILIQ